MLLTSVIILIATTVTVATVLATMVVQAGRKSRAINAEIAKVQARIDARRSR